MIRAVYATKILETKAFQSVPLDRSLLAGYIFHLSKADKNSEHFAVQIIHRTVDCILHEAPNLQERKLDYLRELSNLIIKDADDLQTITYGLQWENSTSGKPDYRQFRECVPMQDVLTAATHLGLTSLVKTLIARGAQDTWSRFDDPLLRAVGRGDIELVRILLAVSLRGGASSATQLAAARGHDEILFLLLKSTLEECGQVTEKDHFGAIKGAASGGQLRTLLLLLEAAQTQYKLDDLQALRKHFRNKLGQDMYRAIFVDAARNGREEVVQYILESRVDLGDGPRSQRSPVYGWDLYLDRAAHKGYEGTVQVLLEMGLEKGWVDEDSCILARPLHYAVRGGWPHIAQMLLDHGASPAKLPALQEGSQSHLTTAVEYGQPDMLRFLLDAKEADWQADSKVCQEAYAMAKARGYTTSMSHFVERGLIPKHGI